MLINKRQKFLNIFLQLYNVIRVEIKDASITEINGTAMYEDQESQDFCWHMSEDQVSSDDIIELIKIIYKNKFNQTDKITTSLDEIFIKSGWLDRCIFDENLDQLFGIEIKMIDDGEETDSFFLHN